MAKDVFVLGIDQSTQGTKGLLFDSLGNLVDKAILPHRQIINDLGFVEHDLNEIAQNVIEVTRQIVSKDKSRADLIETVGISVQRETVGAWRRSTLKPLYNAIVWQCARGIEQVSRKKVQSKAQRIREITGLELSEYFSAAKITWLVDHVAEVQDAIANHDLCVGNMDAFLIAYLTHGKCFSTEPSNASRTQLMDLRNLCWSEELCDLFKVPLEGLPVIKETDAMFGYTNFEGVLNREIPIHCVIGDSMGALFGHGCLKSGQVKTTYGTGSSIMMNSGDSVSACKKGIVNSVGWRREGKTTYVLEGNINYSAGIISYLKDDLKIINDPKETAAMAKASRESDRCYFVPALSGLGAPYFNSNVRGALLGMSRVTGNNEIVRAALDSIAYQVNDILALIRESTDEKLSALHVDGGATKNDYLMQFQSDLVGIPLYVPKEAELSGMGAAFMAGIAVGVYTEDILSGDKISSVYKPSMAQNIVMQKVEDWHKAVSAAITYGL